MNPYSAPTEVGELSEDLKTPRQGNWPIWLGAGFLLVLFAIPLIATAAYNGWLSRETLAAIILVAGIGCLFRASETSRQSKTR